MNSASGQEHIDEAGPVDEHVDVVVIGGGAAGLAGGVILGRSRRRVLVVDGGEPRNAPADGVHNFLTREGTPPAEILALGRAEVESYGNEVRAGRVVDARPEGDGFVVALDDGTRVRARRLLVATGLVDELPPIDGLRDHWGEDVIHCPFCHGWEARDQPIGVLGTGPMAMHGTLLFRALSEDVVLFRHTAPPLTPEQQEQLDALGVRVVEGEVAAVEAGPDGRLARVRLASGEAVDRTTVVVAPRFVSRTHGLDGLGLEIEPHPMGAWLGEAIVAEPTGKTTVPGVWVAGNATDLMAQVIGAADAGARAGAQIHGELMALDAAAAVDAHRARLAGATA